MTVVRTVVGGIAAVMMCASVAQAQATRTWVSGVGDDANPCSRTAPCKTWAGAISKTATNGEINSLDNGGFGTLTITKNITVNGSAQLSGALAAGVTGFNVNAAGINVTLRGLSINGVTTGVNGVNFLQGNSLHVENCDIANFTTFGIKFEPATAAFLFVKNSVIRNNAAGGIHIKANIGGVGVRRAVITNTHLDVNAFGVKVDTSVISTSGVATVVDSYATASGLAGFWTTGTGAVMVLNSSTASANVNGIRYDAGSTIRCHDSISIQNITSDQVVGGTLVQTGHCQIG